MESEDFRSIDVRQYSVDCQHEILNSVAVQTVISFAVRIEIFLADAC